MQHWYVYYSCSRAACEQMIARVKKMQESLAASSGTIGRLVQSADSGDRTTMMEIYEQIDRPEQFAAALDDALARSGLPAEIRGARHIERFMDV